MMATLLMVTALACGSLLYHPVHETLWEVQWNDKTKVVEVALRLNALDEQWIRDTHRPDRESDWQAEFLKRHVFFDPVKRKPAGTESLSPQYGGLPIKWLGRKEDGAHVWWFFEVKPKDKNPPTELRSRLLFDHERDYQHWIIILRDRGSDSKRQPALVLTRERPQLKLVLSDEG